MIVVQNTTIKPISPLLSAEYGPKIILISIANRMLPLLAFRG
jgi:hypothetical protein